MLYKVKDLVGTISVGDRVRSNGDGAWTCDRGCFFEGSVTEVGPEFLLIQRDDQDSNFRWKVLFSNELALIEILTPKKASIMSDILSFFRDLTATADERLLKEMGLEDPIGTPTDMGFKLSAEISYKANRAKVIEIAQKLKAEQDAKKK